MHFPRHSTIVAYLALFTALGGTAFAAAKFTGADIVDNSLTSADIQDRSLRSTDFAEGQLGGTAPITHVAKDFDVTTDQQTVKTIELGQFTQKAGEVLLLAGQVQETAPADGTCTEQYSTVDSNGQWSSHFKVGRVMYDFKLDGGDTVSPLGDVSHGVAFAPTALPAPAADKTHTLTLEVRDTCGMNGGTATAGFTVTGAKIDMVHFQG